MDRMKITIDTLGGDNGSEPMVLGVSEALKAYDDANGNFDVALLDIMMPGINGMEVCKKLREKSANLGIIMLSAKSQEMDKISSLMIGADDYITKPFSISELIARVDAV